MQIRFKAFAGLKEILGSHEGWLELPDSATVKDLVDHVFSTFPESRKFERSLMVAVNEEYAAPAKLLTQNDEIALIPPVSGG